MNEYDFIQNKNKSEIEIISEITNDISKSEKFRITKDSMINIDIFFKDLSALRHRISKQLFNKYLKNLIL